MKFNDLHPDLIYEIYNYLENYEIQMDLCNLTQATRIAAATYNIFERVEEYFEVQYLEDLFGLAKLINIYPNLDIHINVWQIADQLGCICSLEYLKYDYESEDDFDSYHDMEIILLDFARGFTLEEIMNRSKTDCVKHLVMDVYVHFSKEENITEEMKLTESYNKRLRCRQGECTRPDEAIFRKNIKFEFP